MSRYKMEKKIIEVHKDSWLFSTWNIQSLLYFNKSLSSYPLSREYIPGVVPNPRDRVIFSSDTVAILPLSHGESGPCTGREDNLLMVTHRL